jgi:hypothetical protein
MFTEAAICLITNERMRQVNEEGWSIEHDDAQTIDQLARAAACYAIPEAWRFRIFPMLWGWDRKWWKPTPDDRIRELTKAGALIVAEISRLLREKARESGELCHCGQEPLVGRLCYDHAKACGRCGGPYDPNSEHVCIPWEV